MSLEFIKLYKEVVDHTLLTPDRLWHLWRAPRLTRNLIGCMAECGVFKGGSAKMIYKSIHGKKKLHLFDTFSGIPASQRGEGDHLAGEFSSSHEEVHKFLSDCPKVVFHKGLVPDTLNAVESERFHFVHLDMDLYKPTIDALRFFWPRMAYGSQILLDDWESIAGVTEAVREFSSEVNTNITKTTTMQCVLLK